MKTDDLIGMLATGAGAVEPHAAARHYAAAIVGGTIVAVLLMASLLGVRSDLAAAMLLPMFWVKFGFVAALVGASLLFALRLSRPGLRLEWVPGALAAPVLALWVLAVVALASAGPEERSHLFFGDTWTSCPLLVAMLSAPVFAGVLWAMKGLAPTRLRLAGAAAGLLSGTVGALVYCLHCPELSAPFIGFWYLLGMLIPTSVGALLGPRLLRW